MADSNTPKNAPDWERIELDYRAGIKTLRQIADENGITHGAINKRAKRDGWERDLSAKIHAKADVLVSKAMVSSAVSTESKIAEKNVIDSGDHWHEVQAREDFAFRSLARIRPKSKDEAVSVLRYLATEEAMDREETGDILLNLIGR